MPNSFSPRCMMTTHFIFYCTLGRHGDTCLTSPHNNDLNLEVMMRIHDKTFDFIGCVKNHQNMASCHTHAWHSFNTYMCQLTCSMIHTLYHMDIYVPQYVSSFFNQHKYIWVAGQSLVDMVTCVKDWPYETLFIADYQTGPHRLSHLTTAGLPFHIYKPWLM